MSGVLLAPSVGLEAMKFEGVVVITISKNKGWDNLTFLGRPFHSHSLTRPSTPPKAAGCDALVAHFAVQTLLSTPRQVLAVRTADPCPRAPPPDRVAAAVIAPLQNRHPAGTAPPPSCCATAAVPPCRRVALSLGCSAAVSPDHRTAGPHVDRGAAGAVPPCRQTTADMLPNYRTAVPPYRRAAVPQCCHAAIPRRRAAVKP